MKRAVPRFVAAACIAGLAAAPFVVGSFPLYILSMWLITALSAIGLNICLGLGAMYSFGHGAFMLVGAYGTTVAMTHLGFPLIPALIFAVVLAALVGVVIGLPALRLSGFALAIVTFSFGFMLSNLVKAFDFAGGPQGMVVPDSAVSTMLHGAGLYYLTAACFLAALGMFASLSGSKTGRALRTLGENPVVARSLGINLARTRIAAFVLSACCGALAGGLLAAVTGFVSPETFSPELSINMFAAVVIGGVGTIIGPLLGAFFIVIIPELTQSVQNLAQIIYAVLFCLAVTLFPSGLVGMGRATMTLYRKIAAPIPAA